MSRKAKILAQNIQNNPNDFKGEELERAIQSMAEEFHRKEMGNMSINDHEDCIQAAESFIAAMELSREAYLKSIIDNG
jgi:hypothetical protein